MRWLAVMIGVATSAAAQPRASRCWAACERNVSDERVRATACGACLLHPDDLAAWLERAPAPRDALLRDPEWEVRWGALRLEARRTRGTAALELAAWLKRDPGARERVCVTAIHAAGGTKTALAKLFEKAPAVREACAAPELLSLELYDEQLALRREALEHVALAFERAPARVVLDVLPSRPATFDAMVLDTLEAVQSETGQSSPAALLAAATARDVDAMNRALAVFARRRDVAVAQFGAARDRTERKVALLALAALAPLSEAELLEAVLQSEPALRATAIRGLARGEGGSIPDVVARRLSGERPATPEQRAALLRLMGDTAEPACATVAMSAWGDRALPTELRALALATAASCRWEAAAAETMRALQSEALEDRVAAVGALAYAPATEQLFEQLRWAARRPEPELKLVACESMAARRWRGGLTTIGTLVTDADPRVRAAALKALLALEAEGLEGRLSQRAAADPTPEVRKVALELLGRLGTPRAIGALTEAARNDADADVKLVAEQTLRRLRSP